MTDDSTEVPAVESARKGKGENNSAEQGKETSEKPNSGSKKAEGSVPRVMNSRRGEVRKLRARRHQSDVNRVLERQRQSFVSNKRVRDMRRESILKKRRGKSSWENEVSPSSVLLTTRPDELAIHTRIRGFDGGKFDNHIE